MTDWAHSPVHKLDEKGTYMVTAGTFKKVHRFTTPARLDMLEDKLTELVDRFGWQLQAWALMVNHYHIVAVSPENPESLGAMLSELHSSTAEVLNREDNTPGRRVWYQFWDTQLTYQKSYLARIKYVHNNPAHHNVVSDSAQYQWCSKAWFDQAASGAFKRTIDSFDIDRLNVRDDF